jgi:hypothetical protein
MEQTRITIDRSLPKKHLHATLCDIILMNGPVEDIYR